MGTLKDLGRGASEGCNALRINKGLIQLLSSGTELFVVGNSSRVYNASGAGLRAGRRCTLGLATLVVRLGGGEAAGRVGAGRVLDVFAVLSDESWSELLEFLAEKRNQLCTDELLYGLLLFSFRDDVDVELRMD